MTKGKILSFILSFAMLASCLPSNFVFAADNAKLQRTAYIHAQGTNPTETTDVSTVYTDTNTDIYFAVDNPNKGEYENGIHKEPQYDMNGYTISIYFDPYYFDYANSSKPIDYTIPDTNLGESESGSENTGSGSVDNVPTEVGYYIYRHGSDTEVINGKTYKVAYLTVFFSGGYIPQKQSNQLWYNLCKLPLKPLRTGSTQVFFDTTGDDYSLELFAKNQSDNLNDQTFNYTAINGGYHTIVIKDKARPSSPTATPPEGSYTETQYVTLSSEDGCDIYCSLRGEEPQIYTTPIEISTTASITCYAKRRTDNKQSNSVKFKYQILPKAPYLFVDDEADKKLIPNIYNTNDIFTVYVSDNNIFGLIDDGSEIYYTFSDIGAESITEGQDPETEWVKLNKSTQSIDITKKRVLRLVTKKLGEYSEVVEYYLNIKPAAPTADKNSGEYASKIDVMLTSATTNAEIYYTVDGSDPITNGTLYNGVITLAKDTTLRAVTKYDGTYSEISSYYYIFTSVDDFGVDAFYPSGVYEGGVNVTLTANNPENDIKYSTDNGITWMDYTTTLMIDSDTVILAKSGKGENWGTAYTFTYKIKPMPPHFSPESTQFTNARKISIFCLESTSANTDRYDLYYTLDGSDPTTSNTRKKGSDALDSADIEINKYTVVKAVVLKDNSTYSTVVTHSYDIVTKKPAKPLVTLSAGNYTRKIENKSGFTTQFMPVASGTEIYYTISYDGEFIADPVPNTSGTIKYDGASINVKGHTIIKAVTVNVFGVKSDIGIFEYIVTPEAPKAAPSATISGRTLPVVPVSAVLGSTVKYRINGFNNEFVAENDLFYLNTQTGNAYKEKDCINILASTNSQSLTAPASLDIYAELDNIESLHNNYNYRLSNDDSVLAAPYADKETGEYEEIKRDDENNLLHINLSSLNNGDTIQYKIDNASEWHNYDGNTIKIKKDTILQVRSTRNGAVSITASYVYNFVPLAPVITLPSGRYVSTDNPKTKIKYSTHAPLDKIEYNYQIMYRENGDAMDVPYAPDLERSIDHTMSFKAYVKNIATGRLSKNTIHYYIIEAESAASGSVYIANPYDATRISTDLLSSGEYANGIKLLTQNNNATIHYFYSYRMKDSEDSITTNNLIYDNVPITINPSMANITITAWLEDTNGRIENSDFTHKIDFVHLNVPVTSLGSETVEFPKNTTYTIVNDYPGNNNVLLYYTLDGSEPTVETNESRKLYNGENLTLTSATTVKAVYLSICGTCPECRNDNNKNCWYKVYGKVGRYNYTVSASSDGGGSSGGGGSSSGGGGGSSKPSGGGTTTDNTRKYTKDIFGNEHLMHISYINGYPDGSVRPDGKITREAITAILYRIINHNYEKPFIATGEAFPDVDSDRWSTHDIEYMTDKKIVYGYPDGEYKPENNLTRAEFATLISRFVKLDKTDIENPFSDLDKSHWAYDNILSLNSSGLIKGYDDGTYRPESQITRAEVMTVVNKILGRNPSDPYVRTLTFNPFNDLEKDKWYYTDVLEATITHSYYLDKNGMEIKWE